VPANYVIFYLQNIEWNIHHVCKVSRSLRIIPTYPNSLFHNFLFGLQFKQLEQMEWNSLHIIRHPDQTFYLKHIFGDNSDRNATKWRRNGIFYFLLDFFLVSLSNISEKYQKLETVIFSFHPYKLF